VKAARLAAVIPVHLGASCRRAERRATAVRRAAGILWSGES